MPFVGELTIHTCSGGLPYGWMIYFMAAGQNLSLSFFGWIIEF